MTKKFLFLLLLIPFYFSSLNAQNEAFQDGEWLKLRIHYGWFNASFTTLEVKEKEIGNTPVYHVIGEGKSTGLLHAFFKVSDTYQSWIRKDNQLPVKFHRKINEGGHKKNKIIYFDQNNQKTKVRDLKHDTQEEYSTKKNVQDMISAFYFVRNQIGDHLQEKGDSLTVDMFFDEENYKFKTVLLEKETIKTKFGKVKTLKLQPYVQAGRVFEKQESLTVWVTDDKNHLPVRIKAKLAVGSLTADLHEYKNLAHAFETVD